MPEMCARASSVSRSVRDALPAASAGGLVVALSQRACIIHFGGERLAALVAPEVDDGPLNIVLECAPGRWLDLQPGAPVQFQGDRLQLGGLDVSLDGAAIWEPRPDWERLRAGSVAILNRLNHLLPRIEACVPGGTMLALVHGVAQDRPSSASAVGARAREAAEAMWSGWCGDEGQLRSGAAQLAGLGAGLTPAGDDFILGAMLSAWLAHPNPRHYCETVLEACASKTTMLSAAFLRSAAAGECSAPWHCLLEMPESSSDEQVGCAARAVLSYGHTSGADALAGFLWTGLRLLQG